MILRRILFNKPRLKELQARETDIPAIVSIALSEWKEAAGLSI